MNALRFSALFAGLVLLSSTVAHAQTTPTPSAEATAAAASSLLSTTIAVPLTGLGVVIYAVVTTAQGNNSNNAAAAEVYLRQNATQLAQDLTSGEGPTLLDLASAAEIRQADYAVFAAKVRAERTALLELADVSKLTAERAATFMTRIGDIVKGDETLAVSYHAFLERHGLKG